MDERRIDDVTRQLATRLRRRNLTLATTATLIGGLLWPGPAMACKKLKKACDKDKDCCDGAKCKKDKCACKNGWKDCDGDGTCEDLDTDDAHCGACGVVCGGFERCCGGACTSIRDNDAHCGLCDVTCAAEETCCSLQCTDLQSDRLNCGVCGNRCPSTSDQCIDGACVPFICPAEANHCDDPTSECNGQVGCRCLSRSSNGETICAGLRCGSGCDHDADCASLGTGAFCASGGDFCCTGMNGQDVCAVPCSR